MGYIFLISNSTVPSVLLFTEKIPVFERSLIFFDATDSVELLVVDIFSHLKLLFPWFWSYGRNKKSPIKSPVSSFLLLFSCNEKLRMYINHFLMFLWLTFFSILHTSTSYERCTYTTLSLPTHSSVPRSKAHLPLSSAFSLSVDPQFFSQFLFIFNVHLVLLGIQ